MLSSTPERDGDAPSGGAHEDSAAGASRAPSWPRNLPWIDAGAALTAGALVLALREPLSAVHGVSRSFLTTLAAVNLLYSGFGLTLGVLRSRPRWLLAALVAANLLWAAVCVVLVVRLPVTATSWAHAHLLGEAAFVALLASLEVRHRDRILAPRS